MGGSHARVDGMRRPVSPPEYREISIHTAGSLGSAVSGLQAGIRCIPFELKGGARETTHHASRTFENQVWSAHAIYEACKADPHLEPAGAWRPMPVLEPRARTHAELPMLARRLAHSRFGSPRARDHGLTAISRPGWSPTERGRMHCRAPALVSVSVSVFDLSQVGPATERSSVAPTPGVYRT